MGMKHWNCTVLREEMLKLTGDFKLALVLDQMIYWSQRVSDFKAYMNEERARSEGEACEGEAGWIFKKAEELVEEFMVNVSPKAMRAYLKEFVHHGWLEERNNQKIRWDHTKQYRVSLVKIQADLEVLGYYLKDYREAFWQCGEQVLQDVEPESSVEKPEGENSLPHTPSPRSKEPRSLTIPKITSKTIQKTTSERVPYRAIIQYLNEKTMKTFRETNRLTRKLIKERWDEGYRMDAFVFVIDQKTKEWLGDERMDTYLRPKTLFSEHFENYVNENRQPEGLPGDLAFEKLLNELDEKVV
ncbi:conserved phage C-terminal domain-containing protein [Alteribacter keqinensis]|uniref:Phage conserved hypothetical protein C-terminal domain-containing protein n=1 Tax=Alteribacter keqinensis TaxID=2483800 RepID=A0A3M7TND2_9BACI|nr:conserved phage C-terminal domain-containing protein [Alteribacter keqinensis]RNA66626.1 hypothetical protein EBO34_15515 [Alteribacter keqinensis]